MRTLVLCEKPLAAQDVAAALGGGGAPGEVKSAGYISVGKDTRVTWFSGHLLGLAEPGHYCPAWSSRKVFPVVPEKFRFVPLSKKAHQRLEALKKLVGWAELVINACDAGREGELIFANFWDYIESPPLPVRRLWMSSTDPDAVKLAWSKMEDWRQPKYNQLAVAARTRTCADWLVGINASRAVTELMGGSEEWTVGRVQTAALYLVFRREKLVREFESRAYFSLYPKFTGVDSYEGKVLVPEDFKKLGRFSHIFATEQEALAAEHLVKMTGSDRWQVEDKTKPSHIFPYPLFDLEGLQRFCARALGWSGVRTLQAAQQAYMSRAITYPRTDSEYLPDSMREGLPILYAKNWNNVGCEVGGLNALDPPDLEAVVADKMFSPFNSKKVRDHHAILPTGLIPPDVQSDAYLVWRVISRRFLLFFCPAAKTIKLERLTKLAFPLRSSFLGYRRGDSYTLSAVTRLEALEDEGWLATASLLAHPLPESLPKPRRMPRPEPHGVVLDKVEFYQGFTEPPENLNEETLLAQMTASGLGTPATQAEAIESLVQRDYLLRVRGCPPQLQLTKSGHKLITELLHHRLPLLTNLEITAGWEKLFEVFDTSNLAQNSEDFLGEVCNYVAEISTVCRGGQPKVKCPLSGLPVVEAEGHYVFPGCPKPLSKKLGQRHMLAWEYREILRSDKPVGPYEFVSKKGRRFEARLSYDRNLGEVKLAFD
jgi:DNA topoisomerase-3